MTGQVMPSKEVVANRLAELIQLERDQNTVLSLKGLKQLLPIGVAPLPELTDELTQLLAERYRLEQKEIIKRSFTKTVVETISEVVTEEERVLKTGVQAGVRMQLEEGAPASWSVSIGGESLKTEREAAQKKALQVIREMSSTELSEEWVRQLADHRLRSLVWRAAVEALRESYGKPLPYPTARNLAFEAIKCADWSKASEYLRDALGQSDGKDREEITFLLAWAYLRCERASEADKLLDPWVRRQSDGNFPSRELAFLVAVTCLDLGRLQDAEYAFKRLKSSDFEPTGESPSSLVKLPDGFQSLCEFYLAFSRDNAPTQEEMHSLLDSLSKRSPDSLRMLRECRLPGRVPDSIPRNKLEIKIDGGWLQDGTIWDRFGFKNASEFSLTEVEVKVWTVDDQGKKGPSWDGDKWHILPARREDPCYACTRRSQTNDQTAQLMVRVTARQGSWEGVIWAKPRNSSDPQEPSG